ncbi:uncharacterized protein F5147DRAFT_776303 [Suillus discolor]|uniref:Uncharacterized protein n=1 Tax=Suillus discolor TaxID=1912936 RepID=A0A9P7JRX8_9AGAM|nr:uncharacterized protein F5147DRAFT_776303 [Suillus discolor]KAG2102555.1 hypothetical protein F5147DRAFT_776303 [Suillus discolor]
MSFCMHNAGFTRSCDTHVRIIPQLMPPKKNTAKKRAAGGVALKVSVPLGSPNPYVEDLLPSGPAAPELPAEIHSLWCMICRDGAEGDVVLYKCDACPRVMCSHCIEVPTSYVNIVQGVDVLFLCLSCHSLRSLRKPAPYFGFYSANLPDRGGHPVLPHFLRLNGKFEAASCTLLASMPVTIIHFIISATDEVITPVPLLSHYLEHFSPTVLSTVFRPYLPLLKAANMVLLVCGSIVTHEDAFVELKQAILDIKVASAIIFPAKRFQPLVATNFLLALAELVIIEQLDLHKVFPSLLSLSNHLGLHSKIISMTRDNAAHFPRLLVTTYARAHPQTQPWGIEVPSQCPLCGSTNSWSEKVSVTASQQSQGVAAQDQAAGGKSPHRFQIDKPPGFLVNAAKSRNSGWFQSPSAIFPSPSVQSAPISATSSISQAKRPRSSKESLDETESTRKKARN